MKKMSQQSDRHRHRAPVQRIDVWPGQSSSPGACFEAQPSTDFPRQSDRPNQTLHCDNCWEQGLPHLSHTEIAGGKRIYRHLSGVSAYQAIVDYG
jgi:hypothetical protein